MTGTPAKVYTIPAGIPFGEALAAKLLQQYKDHPEKLAEILILLPTRRACRIVRDAFLRQSGGVALLLPRLQTLGDVDEDALGLEIAALSEAGTDALDIPPALSTLRRRIILTQLILSRGDYQNSPDQALLLADALGHLLDTIYTEGRDISALPALVDRSKFSEHWQITLDFLTIISVAWPEILKEMGVIDAADRRNRLLQSLADHWQKHPPTTPIIVAGSTGSIPAAGNLLHIVATLPNGCVVVPGLDKILDERSWQKLDDTHPQATLRNLLNRMNLDRSQVQNWTDRIPPRQELAAEIMRPAETTDNWRALGQNAPPIRTALENLQRIDCPTPQEEARLISLIFRHVQHNPPSTAVLVTFDRDLARRVAASCARWGLTIDDSAGIPLASTPAGTFLNLCAQVSVEQLAPVPLLSLLKHKLTTAGMDPADFRAAVRRLDRDVLRGPRPGPGLEGLQQQATLNKQGDRLQQFFTALNTCLGPFLDLCDGHSHPFAEFLTSHLTAAEALTGGPDPLWTGEDGDAAALFLADLRANAASLPNITCGDYLPMLQTLMHGITVRPAWGMHPRLSILGPLETRMLNADVVILGSMNENSWPPAPENDPWMSRPMRKDFGLPALERGVGLSAHDFVQGFCAPTVILTRSERAGTAPTIPSRWLQRLDTVLKATGLAMAKTDWLDKTRELDEPTEVKPVLRPDPRPPVEKRPNRLSVTQIETWMRDPYALYARHVLNLDAIDNIDELPGAADKGNITHKALEEFAKAYPLTLPVDAEAQLLTIGHTLLDDQIKDVRTRHFWGVRFDKTAEWWVPHEIEWRTDARTLKTEIKDEMIVPGHDFTLVAKADRIDLLGGGEGIAIIDYKTGSPPSKKDIVAGLSPQLPLEAAMIRAGGFTEIQQRDVGYLGHWVLNGKDGGKADQIKEDPAILADAALTGLQNLISGFANQNTPYLSVPRPNAAPRYNDYRHLARIQEWAVLDDSDGGDS
ncbi:MAG: double-strand break repair protein AddB [Micavibrio sp.]|nr:double-strand break repair protein AddB [Micavibrio sp.]